MSTTKKLISAALVLFMLLPLFCACSGGKDENTTESNVTVNTAEEEKLVLPQDIRFDGKSYQVLSAGNQVYNDFDHDEESESVLEQAQYSRKKLIQQENGVDIELKMIVNKESFGNGPGYQEISRAVSAEDIVYHLGLIGGYDVANLASNSLFMI